MANNVTLTRQLDQEAYARAPEARQLDPRPLNPRTRPFAIVGHRGAKDLAAENTAAGFRLAEDIGVDQIELDVRITSDGVAVIVHDETMERLAAAPHPYSNTPVSHLSLAQIRVIPLASGQQVLTFADVLATTECTLQVEIKDPRAVPAVAGLLAEIPSQKRRICVTSFLPEALAALKLHLPDVPRGLIVSSFPATAGARRDMEEVLCTMGASALYTGFENLTAAQVDRYHAAGLEVHVWPVSSPLDVQSALDLNADGGTADDPRQAKAWLASLQPMAQPRR